MYAALKELCICFMRFLLGQLLRIGRYLEGIVFVN